MFAQPTGKPVDPRRDQYEWKALLEEAGVGEARLHDARHTAATTLQMSIVAFDASFSGSGEHAPPAMQRAALKRAQSDNGPCGMRDLRCQHRVASGAAIMHPVRLHRIPA